MNHESLFDQIGQIGLGKNPLVEPCEGKLHARFFGEGLETGENPKRQPFTRQEFFKWIKQHLKVKKFFGDSPNAVLIQILTALIVYVLLLLIQEELNFQGSLLELTRIFKNNITEIFDEHVFRR